jgi:hypothetical protein
MEAMTMSYSRDILEELHTLKREAGHALKTSAEEWQQVSREKAHSLAAGIKTLVNDFRDALALDEAEVERAFAGRAAALATDVHQDALTAFTAESSRRKPQRPPDFAAPSKALPSRCCFRSFRS